MACLWAGSIQGAYSHSFEVETQSLWGFDQITLIIRIERKVSLPYASQNTVSLCSVGGRRKVGRHNRNRVEMEGMNTACRVAVFCETKKSCQKAVAVRSQLSSPAQSPRSPVPLRSSQHLTVSQLFGRSYDEVRST